MNLLACLKSDLYRAFHSPLWIIHLVIPVVGATLFVWYYSFAAWDEVTKLSAYVEIVAVIFPLIVGLVTAMVSEEDRKAGDFQQMLTIPAAKWVPHVSKLLLLSAFGLVASIIAILGFGIGFRGIGFISQNLTFFIQSGLLMFASVLPLYLLHYVVSYLLGRGVSIGMGITGSLLSALLVTGLGDRIWWFVPWGINARLSEILLVSRVSNITFLQYNGVVQSILTIVILSLIILLFLFLAMNRWEGRKAED